MATESSWRTLWALDPNVRFLNHGSFGACPKVVIDAQRDWQLQLESQPVAFFERDCREPWEKARAALATFVGARADDLVFLSNATTGVNTVLRSLDFSPGDELLVTDHAYNACANALKFVAKCANVSIRTARIPFPIESADQAVDAILGQVTNRTKLALIDHITSATGLVLPIAQIVEELNTRGVDTLVDGAHSVGHVELDLSKLGAAYYTSNCHKWLCTPKGTAFLHVRADRQVGMRPLTISHAASRDPEEPGFFHAEFDWQGTADPTGFLTIPLAIEYLGSLFPGGWRDLRAHNRALALEARRIIGDRLSIPPAAPEDMLGNLVAFPLQPRPGLPDHVLTPDPLHERLMTEANIEVPVFRWFSPPHRFVRISAQLYNHADEYRELADALMRLGEGPTS